MSRVRRIPVSTGLPLYIVPVRATEKQLLMWVLANGVGHLVAVGALILFFVLVPVRLDIKWTNENVWVIPLYSSVAAGGVGSVDGLSVGVMQGLVLRRYTRLVSLHGWVIATLLGGIGGWAIGWLTGFLAISSFTCGLGIFFMPGAVAGAFVGFAQRRVLARQFGPKVTWVGINVGAGVVSVIVGILAALVPFGVSPEPLSAMVVFTAGGLAYGVVTAGAFGRLLQLNG